MDSKTIRQIKYYEKRFSRNQYNGGGTKPYHIIRGSGCVMISAPHAVNQFREGNVKVADMLTGAIALYLHKVTGCHLIYSSAYSGSDPNYDSDANGGNSYQSALKEYIDANGITILIDLHGAAATRPYAVELGTAPLRGSDDQIIGNPYRSLKNDSFVADLIKYTFEYFLRDCPAEKKNFSINEVFGAGRQNTVTKYVCENTEACSLQLEINREYRDVEHPENLCQLIVALKSIITMLANCDWAADQHRAFRLCQSYKHKPQDEIQIKADKSTESMIGGSYVYISSFLNIIEMARVHEVDQRNIARLAAESQESLGEDVGQYAFLTNRLIQGVFGREWNSSTLPSLIGAPLIVNIYKDESFQIGLPKADRIDQISFSSLLYKELSHFIADYDIAVHNRYCDSKMFIDMKKADYRDEGRVKDSNGLSAKKVMIPRYYKRLLGYMDLPLKMIRKDEFDKLLHRIHRDVEVSLKGMYTLSGTEYLLDQNSFDYKKLKTFLNLTFEPRVDAEALAALAKEIEHDIAKILKESYEVIRGEDFYTLTVSDDNSSMIQKLIAVEAYLKLYDEIEIIKIHKKKERKPFWQRLRELYDAIYIGALKIIVGKNDYSMKVVWTSETDDKNNVARLSRNMMNLLGISDNDKIYVIFGGKTVILRSLCNDELTDYEIGMPAPARKVLGMGSVNDIVEVSRELKHVFKRHSQEQTLAILGLFLAVFQVVDNLLLGIYMCALLTPIVIYFILNEERIKVK